MPKQVRLNGPENRSPETRLSWCEEQLEEIQALGWIAWSRSAEGSGNGYVWVGEGIPSEPESDNVGSSIILVAGGSKRKPNFGGLMLVYDHEEWDAFRLGAIDKEFNLPRK